MKLRSLVAIIAIAIVTLSFSLTGCTSPLGTEAKTSASASAFVDNDKAIIDAARQETAYYQGLKVAVTKPDYLYVEPSPGSAKERCVVEYGGELTYISVLPKGFYKEMIRYADGSAIVRSNPGDRYSPDLLLSYSAPAPPVPPSPIERVENCSDGATLAGSLRQFMEGTVLP